MELLKSIIIDFCLFSLIEGWIYCLFFEKVCGCKKFKWYHITILSLGNCIISQIFPPLIYQLIMILWMGYIIYLYNNKKYIICCKYVLYFIIFMLIIEMLYNIILEYFININGFILNKFKLFLIILPIKIIEILLIIIYKYKKEK